MTAAKRRICELDAKSIAYYRRNPCIASRDLLGIELLDYQKYILQGMWNASHSVIAMTRNGGKSFVGAVFILLKAMLYENQAIYIVSSVGEQSKELFTKIEDLVLRIGKTAASFKSLKDIAEKETVKTPTNKTGFCHNPAGYEVRFYNGSAIYTLNSNPDSARSRRATLVFFDEAAYCSDELISVCEAFATQSTAFVTSTDASYNPELEPRRCPTQLVYASSQGDMSAMFYQHYKNFAKNMFAGDLSYFVCDMTCDVAINTYMNGMKYLPLLSRENVDTALKANKEKALREYYNQPQTDAGVNSIVRMATIRRNESFTLPALSWAPGYTYVIAFDPARVGDNSIMGVMGMYEDPNYGWVGEIVNCVNQVDISSSKHYKLDSGRQLAELRRLMRSYSGNTAADYEYLECVLIDAGSGGGGVSTYADQLLSNWTDDAGVEHRGLIDKTYDIYSSTDYDELYPDAVDKLRIISPKKYRTAMVEEFIDLMNLGVIKFPYEYRGGDSVSIIAGTDSSGEEIMEDHSLTEEEILALQQIDLMKYEIAAIQKTQNADKTTVQYALSKEKAATGHDDRFYVAILLAHYLYQKRKGAVLETAQKESYSYVSTSMCVSSIAF